MHFRKLLVPALGDGHDAVALGAAMALARQFESHVVALAARPSPSEALPYLGEGLSGAVVQEILNTARKAGDDMVAAVETALRTAAAKAGVTLMDAPGARPEPTAALLVREGYMPEVVLAESPLSDLVVFGAAASDAARLRESLEAALISAGRPVLVVPPESPAAIGTRVAIAYDGGTAAAHAVTAALPFLTRAKAITLYHVTAGDKDEARLGAVRDYLALRGLGVTEHVIDPGEQSTGAAIMGAAARAQADLLVMGGYGHSRLREFVLGGVTRHVLGTPPPVPIMMAH